MTRGTKLVRFVAALTALWIVAGADWPIDDVIGLLGGMPCC